MERKTILVNGMLYDAISGMPIKKQSNSRASMAPGKRQAKTSHQIHRQIEPSRVASRHVPVAPHAPTIQKRSDTLRVPQPGLKSSVVTRFGSQAPVAQKQPRVMSDIRPATVHPIAQKVEARMRPAHAQNAPIKPSQLIKQEAIDEALASATSHRSTGKQIKHPRKTPRMLSFASMALSLLLLAGYLTYINLPNLSVRVAASQAGIDAGYPGYRPDGYRLAGVNYDKGSVSLKFAANAGPQNFTITQQQTSWDSTAVKENYVKTKWGDDVVPYSERGLTIYAHEGNAAWVNGGILYTITGDATLSTTQVRSIATSL